MRFGLMDGPTDSEVSIKTYIYYANCFLRQYEKISLGTLKNSISHSPKHYAKRLKLYQALTSLAKILIEEQALARTYLLKSKKVRPRRHLPENPWNSNPKLMYVLKRLIVVLLSQTGLV